MNQTQQPDTQEKATRPLPVRIDPEKYLQIRIAAAKLGISMHQWMVSAVYQKLEQIPAAPSHLPPSSLKQRDLNPFPLHLDTTKYFAVRVAAASQGISANNWMADAIYQKLKQEEQVEAKGNV